jgi:outer membrane protein OmpA-like peptidoglycan-associated protein
MKTSLSLLALAAAAAFGSACATKKFVRQTVDPVNQRVTELDKRAADNAKAIEQLDDSTKRDISRVDEKVQAADNRAAEADRKAGEGIAKATQAAEKAENARTLAENSLSKTGALEKAFANLENYRMASTKTVYFAFNKAGLDDAAKKELDALAQSLGSHQRFVLEVQGFTDSTGAAEYNYELSERRANNVVRYLTLQHKVPAYRVHRIGLGEDVPAAAAEPREARKLSRRVEVRVYVPSDSPVTSAQSR